jgi:hypothetical protein
MIMKRSFRRGELQYKMADKWKADCVIFCNQQDVRLSDKRNFKPTFRSQADLKKTSEVGLLILIN